MSFLPRLAEALLMALGMFWEVGWSLVLGFAISAILQVFVSKQRMTALLGRDGTREVALATLFGAASSSCSYASAAIARTLLAKGAALIPALAFLLSSTNLVIELGMVLYILMGWQFMLAEWLGGIVLVVIMSGLVRLTYPHRLVEDARLTAERPTGGHEHDHGAAAVPGNGFWSRLLSERGRIAVAQSFAMDWAMLWKDLVAGFLIAGFLAVFVPNGFWQGLFAAGAPAAVQVPLNALIGPLIAVVSFVCSIGNVPMAAVLWGSGISFGGVLAFLYGDLIVLPLLDTYRRAFGWRMAAYIAAMFYATMVLAAIVMDLGFAALGLVPQASPDMRGEMARFALDYTFWLNLAFGALAAYLGWLAWRHPMHAHNRHEHAEHHGHAHHHHNHH